MRLQRETLTDGHPQGQRVTTWTYDAVGNRLTETQARGPSTVTVSSTYDVDDRLLTEQGTNGSLVTYVYDDAGQLTARTDATVATSSTTTFTYDVAHRLESTTGPAGATSYRYDADGIRQSETVAGVTTRFVVDPTQPYPQVIAELGAAGPSAETHYALGLGGGTRLTRRQGGVTTYLHTDALGSLRLTTTAAGAASERWAYRAFGDLDQHISVDAAHTRRCSPCAWARTASVEGQPGSRRVLRRRGAARPRAGRAGRAGQFGTRRPAPMGRRKISTQLSPLG